MDRLRARRGPLAAIAVVVAMGSAGCGERARAVQGEVVPVDPARLADTADQLLECFGLHWNSSRTTRAKVRTCAAVRSPC